jgi:DNA (cytosine-5)-methyltransferase 1
MRRKLKVISLFSGGMGLDLGLESTGKYKIVACVELNKSACKTIRHNQRAGRLPKSLRLYEGDISNFDPQALLDDLKLKPGEIDLVAGGPPCQSFSTAGKRGTIQDVRGTLLWQFLRFVQVMQPKFFLMENVRGLLSAALKHRPIALRPNKGGPPLADDEKPGSVMEEFVKDLRAIKEAPYHMDCFEVNSVNYGAPQLRERVLCIGNRHGVQVDFPNPTHGVRSKKNTEQLSLFPESDEVAPLSPWATLGDAIRNLKDESPEVLDFSPRKKEFLAMVPAGGNWRCLPVDVQKESMKKAWEAKGGRSGWWRRLSYDFPCPTLVTMPNHASTALCHPEHVRALSLREYAAIQEFPQDWEFIGTTSEKYRQVGNAVPIRLGRVAGDTIFKAMKIVLSPEFSTPKLSPEPFRVVYIQSHVRTRSWFKDGKAVTGSKADSGDISYSAPKTIRKTSKVMESSSG